MLYPTPLLGERVADTFVGHFPDATMRSHRTCAPSLPGDKSSGFQISTIAPMTLESLVRKRVRDAGNRSQRINQWSLSERRAVVEDGWSNGCFSDPPAPVRVIGARSSASLPRIFSISSSRPNRPSVVGRQFPATYIWSTYIERICGVFVEMLNVDAGA